MKTILIFLLSLFLNNRFVLSQCSDTNKVVSPVVPKPNGGGFSANCSTLIVYWKGRLGESYEVLGWYIDPATNKKKEISPVDNSNCDGDNNCSTTFKVVAATTVNWTIQAIDEIKGRTFYSYPFRSLEGATIPTCESSDIVTNAERKDNVATPKIGDKVQGELYPNPVRSVLNIKFNSTSNKNQIKVFDVNGRSVITKQATTGTMQLNINQLRSGLYILRIENSNGKALYTARFIKG